MTDFYQRTKFHHLDRRSLTVRTTECRLCGSLIGDTTRHFAYAHPELPSPHDCDGLYGCHGHPRRYVTKARETDGWLVWKPGSLLSFTWHETWEDAYTAAVTGEQEKET